MTNDSWRSESSLPKDFKPGIITDVLLQMFECAIESGNHQNILNALDFIKKEWSVMVGDPTRTASEIACRQARNVDRSIGNHSYPSGSHPPRLQNRTATQHRDTKAAS